MSEIKVAAGLPSPVSSWGASLLDPGRLLGLPGTLGVPGLGAVTPIVFGGLPSSSMTSS